MNSLSKMFSLTQWELGDGSTRDENFWIAICATWVNANQADPTPWHAQSAWHMWCLFFLFSLFYFFHRGLNGSSWR